MKKVVVSVITLLVLSTFIGCKSQLDKNMQNVSEYRDTLYLASGNNFSVQVISGIKETPYEINGISEDKRNFTVITVTPKDFISGGTYRYKLSYSNRDIEGELIQHPFAESFSVDVGEKVSGDITLEVSGEGASENFELKNVIPANKISTDKAYDIAIKKLKVIPKKGESYLRIVSNPIDDEGGYFYYVAFADGNGNIKAVLLDILDGSVRAIRQ